MEEDPGFYNLEDQQYLIGVAGNYGYHLNIEWQKLKSQYNAGGRANYIIAYVKEELSRGNSVEESTFELAERAYDGGAR